VVSLWGIFVSNITLTILIIALPAIAADLPADLALTNWVSFAPMLAVAAITPLAGRAADRYGARRLWLSGFALTLLGIGLSSIAPTLQLLIAARFLTGIGSALFVPAALAITTGLYPPALRATPVGYWTSAVAISPLLGVLLGGYLSELLGWRMLFAGQLLLGLPPLIAGFSLPEQKGEQHGEFDWEGALAAAIAAGSLLCATTWLGKEALTSARVSGALLVTLVSVIWLYSAEHRAEQPVLPPSLLGQRRVQLALFARVALSFTYMGAFMTLPYLLTNLWGLSQSAVSLALLWRPLAMGMTGPLAGRLSLRFGPATLVLSGAWLVALSAALFVGLGAQPNYIVLTAGLMIAGVGLGVGSPGTVATVSARVGPELLGTVSGLMTLTSTLSNALGMAGMFAVVEASGGVHSAHAYQVSALAGTAVSLLGVCAAYALRKGEPYQRGLVTDGAMD
jgi:MFS transporter, DHA2 family, methylenomycin A resistance protein